MEISERFPTNAVILECVVFALRPSSFRMVVSVSWSPSSFRMDVGVF